MLVHFLSVTVLLILITDPLGNIPFFLSALRQVPAGRRQRVVLRECCMAWGALLVFLLAGKPILGMLRLSDESLRVGGGVILMLIAIRMIFPERGARLGDEPVRGEPFIVPLAIPLIAGPSAMATVLLLARQEPGHLMLLAGAVTAAIAVTVLVFALSERIQSLLGDQAITAMERLMGLVLTAIAVEMLLGGIASYIRQFR